MRYIRDKMIKHIMNSGLLRLNQTGYFSTSYRSNPILKLDGTRCYSFKSWFEKLVPSNECWYKKSVASNEYEEALVSSVIRPDEIGITFDDVGGNEHLKELLQLFNLRITEPKLFSRGILSQPMQGLLLFGPPGTGKTLLAKALAAEANAHFINITASCLTSKWFEDADKYATALFSLAKKLDSVIIFINEIDSLLVARGRANENEATRKLWSAFMASWDGLQYSKDSKRILVLGATSSPFDLDDALISRMPSRILVDLPDVENRAKILKVLLAEEDMESGFCFEQLAKATESYSGSDLKYLCIAAAYRPVKHLLQGKSKDNEFDGVGSLRPLKLDDFIRSKAKVRPLVSHNATSLIKLREWNDQYGTGT